MAIVKLHSKTEKETVVKLVEVKVEQPKVIGELRTYSVQYRNYPETIHIQHQGLSFNRHYGFAFDIPGQSPDERKRVLPSLAGTDKVYWPGALVINGVTATLIGANDQVFDVPMATLPQGI